MLDKSTQEIVDLIFDQVKKNTTPNQFLLIYMDVLEEVKRRKEGKHDNQNELPF